MQGFFISIYEISAILQDFFILIIAKSLLKRLTIFFKTGSHLAKSLVKRLQIFF